MAEQARKDSQHPAVRSLAYTYPSPLQIEQFFRASWQVVPDPDEYEYVRAPEFQALFYYDCGYLEGDCDDAATLASSLLKCLDWPNVLTAIRRHGEPEFSHVFTTAVENGYRVSIDPIVPPEHSPIPASEIADAITVLV